MDRRTDFVFAFLAYLGLDRWIFRLLILETPTLRNFFSIAETLKKIPQKTSISDLGPQNFFLISNLMVFTSQIWQYILKKMASIFESGAPKTWWQYFWHTCWFFVERFSFTMLKTVVPQTKCQICYSDASIFNSVTKAFNGKSTMCQRCCHVG